MTLDAWLAIVHHVAVFGLLGVLAAEWGAIRPGIDVAGVARLARLDMAYGLSAALVLGAGVTRVVLGAKPESFYTENPLFWLKLNTFAAVGIISIWPSIRFRRWRRAATAPSDADVAWVRRLIGVQLVLFAAIPTAAALMARGIGS